MSKHPVVAALFLMMIGYSAFAQQFNSDSYTTMPKGTCKFVIAAGQRNSILISSFTLIRNFELFVQANLYRDLRNLDKPQHFNTTLYAKYKFWENRQKTGGAAVLLGFGQSPGYYTRASYSEWTINIWSAMPVTIPLFNRFVYWDLMPGTLIDLNYEGRHEIAVGFSWSTRLAIYEIIPETAILCEFFGTEGKAYSKPEFKAGLRWKPNDFIIPAITYGCCLDGSNGAGLEIGVIIFTPPFLKKDFIRNNKIVH